jgi:hypothetical protein
MATPECDYSILLGTHLNFSNDREVQVGKDTRPVMRAVEAAFKSGDGGAIMARATAGDPAGKNGDLFYLLLYQGLFLEAEGQAEKSKHALLQSAQTPYARDSGDYMAIVAKVHCLRRGWL